MSAEGFARDRFPSRSDAPRDAPECWFSRFPRRRQSAAAFPAAPLQPAAAARSTCLVSPPCPDTLRRLRSGIVQLRTPLYPRVTLATTLLSFPKRQGGGGHHAFVFS